MISELKVAALRCEYLDNPLGIDERVPRLAWRLVSSRRGAAQTAYRIRVASTAGRLALGGADRWDSGWVESGETTQIEYAGAPLASRDACHWTVEVRDERGATATAEPARWTMGLLEPEAWQARWIAADPGIYAQDPEAVAPTLLEPGTPAVFRKEFTLGEPIARATVYATARGVFALRVNGRPVSDDLLAPEWTDYTKRIHYRTYDVTPWMTLGANAIAATLGDGWWTGYVGWQESRGRYGSLDNSLCVQLEVELVSGRRVTVTTDGTWRCGTGPIRSSDLQMGEHYDARREMTGWDGAAFPAAETWLAAREVAAPPAALVAQRSQPVRVMQTLTPVSVKEVRRGVFIVDLGQNFAGFVRLKLRGAPRGVRVQLRHGERLNPDGTLYTENLRRAKATDVYVAKGVPEETWQPHFTFHGFQYVEVTGLDAVTADTVTGCVVHSALPPAGWFECSHAGVNRLWANGLWSQRGNFLSVPTDCPQRDERLGWMGDAQVFLRTASCNLDVAAFFTKWMQDVVDSQTVEGVFPDVAPRIPEDIRFVGLDGLAGAAGWADAGVIVPWTIWRVYGDRRIIARRAEAMIAWVEWIDRMNPRGIRENELGNNYGDWLCIPTDTSFRTHSPMKTLLATAYWADDAAKLAGMLDEIGRGADAERCRALARKVTDAFRREFIAADGRLSVETQTAYLLALAFDLFPEGQRRAGAERLVELIRAADWHLNTGFIGISHLNPTLTACGHADVAYRLLLQETYPSWLYPVKHGATTIWERWNGWTHEDGFFNPQMNSFNHYSLGSVGEWLFRHVAGIELDETVPGYRRFVLRPYPHRSLTYAQARYDTPHGEIASHWEIAGDGLLWRVTVPANTVATVFIPSAPGTTVFERDGELTQVCGLSGLRRDGAHLVATAVAGEYAFHSVLPV